MSSNKFFLDAMAHIDDSLIEDAVKDYKKPKKTFITTLSLVASFVLIIGIALPIILFRFVRTPGDIIDPPQTDQTDTGDTPNIDTLPSDKNILSGSLVFRNDKTNNIAVVDHISDSSIKLVLIKLSGSIDDEYSLIDAIKDRTNNSSLSIIVDGKTADSLPSKEGEYMVEIDFSSVSAKEKEAIIKYYFELNGYKQISQN